MDPLTQILLQRELGAQQPDGGATQPNGVPVVPPNPPTRIPEQTKRFTNAQQIQDAYRNGWSPNPVLLRVQLGHR